MRWLCGDLVERARQGGDTMGRYALGAILVADAAMEAETNFVIESAFPTRTLPRDRLPVHHFAFERLMALRPASRRLVAFAPMMHIRVDGGALPWRAMSELHKVRNALAHFDGGPVSSSDPETKVFPRVQELRPIAEALGTWTLYEQGGTWLDVFLNATVAQWAAETADAVHQVLNSPEWRRGIPFPPPEYS